MIALRLVRLIENHSQELAEDLLRKLQSSPHTADMRRVPVKELEHRLYELMHELGSWLMTKTDSEIRRRYFELGARRCQQGVSLSDFCWSVVLVKEYLWEFLQKQGFLRSPVELYGEVELLRLLDQFFDRALCYAAEGYEEHMGLVNSPAAHVPDTEEPADNMLAGF